MGVIVGNLLLIMEESEVFWMLSSVIEDLLPLHYYNTSLYGAQVQLFSVSGIVLLSYW